MALQTPLHLKSVLLVDGRHLVDLAMASRTTDSLRYVNAVIEIGEFRKVMDTLPLDRRIVTKACTYRFEIRAVRPDLAVAVHARLRRRHSRRGRRLNSGVTISAVDAVITDVVFVTELHRLLLFQVSAREIRRAGDLRINIKRRSRKNDAKDHAYPRDVICTLVKKLRHYQVSRTRRLPMAKPHRMPGGWGRRAQYLRTVNDEKVSVKLLPILLNVLESANIFSQKNTSDRND